LPLPFELAQIEAPSAPAIISPPGAGRGAGRRGVSAPGEGSPPPGGGVLPPEDSGFHGDNVETPLQRRQRLEAAGIVAPPPPRRKVRAWWEKASEALRPDTEDSTGEPLPVNLRIDANFGSWRALKAPPETRYLADFSYGFSFLFPLAPPRREADGRRLAYFLGPSATFYNGGTFQKTRDAYGGRSDVYADTNVTEAGADLLLAQETRLSQFLIFSAEARLTWAPLRQVRAVYNTQIHTPGRSEVGSHSRFNWQGVGVAFGGMFHLGRTVGAGPFLAVSLAQPAQAKARAGLQVLMTSVGEGPAPATTPMPDPVAPSLELKGTRFDKPLPLPVPAPVQPAKKEAP
jgi:hypothetical protein